MLFLEGMKTKLGFVLGCLLLSSAALAEDTTGPDFVGAEPRPHIDPSLVASSGVSRLPKIEPGDVVQFAYDKAQLTDAGYAQIDRAARWLESHPRENVVLEGHASTPGTIEYNDSLANERIARVRGRLLQHGISQDRIVMVVVGERQAPENPADQRVLMYSTKMSPDAVAAAEMQTGPAIAAMWTVGGNLKVVKAGEQAPKVIATRK
jgi:hypothetical protein